MADRMLPEEQLAPWVDAMIELGESVTARMAAEEFGVTVQVAKRALRRLGGAAA